MNRTTIMLAVVLTAVAAPAQADTFFTAPAILAGTAPAVAGETLAGTTGLPGAIHLTHGHTQGLIEILIPDAIEEVENPAAVSYSFYPNPTRDIVNIARTDAAETATLTLTGTSGAVVKQAVLTETVTPVDLSALAPGIYVMTITSPTNRFTAKIIKH